MKDRRKQTHRHRNDMLDVRPRAELSETVWDPLPDFLATRSQPAFSGSESYWPAWSEDTMESVKMVHVSSDAVNKWSGPAPSSPRQSGTHFRTFLPLDLSVPNSKPHRYVCFLLSFISHLLTASELTCTILTDSIVSEVGPRLSRRARRGAGHQAYHFGDDVWRYEGGFQGLSFISHLLTASELTCTILTDSIVSSDQAGQYDSRVARKSGSGSQTVSESSARGRTSSISFR
jgi:hypothetical protein